MAIAIDVQRLVKNYKGTPALRELDLAVDEGVVLALLGPNGAGKTTTVRILATLLEPDSGQVRVCGLDVVTQSAEVRRRIGLSGQFSAVDDHLTALENLEMVGRLYRLGRAEARHRAAELVERFSLNEVADRPAKTYSGGTTRRLDLALALVARPAVLVLDEPTSGLDPRARLSVWEVIREQVAEGTTLLLTTQDMDEADYLADDVTVLEHGVVIGRGTPEELKTRVGGDRLTISVRHGDALPAVSEVLRSAGEGDPMVDVDERRVTVAVRDVVRTLTTVVRDLDQHNVAVEDIALRRPTLEDVFLRLTGHPTSTVDPHSGVEATVR
jgi:ABC-2 type transport system ATP-binding protein